MPDWLIMAIAIATPVLGFLGAALGQIIARRAAQELDLWRRREETMRMLRWGAELTTEPDSLVLGLSVLDSLSRSEMLQPVDEPLINAVLETVTDPVEEIYTEGRIAGGSDECDDD